MWFIFSGKARKMNHFSSLCASEASAKSYFNTFETFTYRCKKWVILFNLNY
ncbi:MAG: hypothetical protein U5L45_25130 [Saprospiraceae bacterium]|nr:hypothetical protein [Saprospiraceae bacterium]